MSLLELEESCCFCFIGSKPMVGFVRVLLEFVFVSHCLCQLVHINARVTDWFVLDPVQVQLNLRLPSMPLILLQIWHKVIEFRHLINTSNREIILTHSPSFTYCSNEHLIIQSFRPIMGWIRLTNIWGPAPTLKSKGFLFFIGGFLLWENGFSVVFVIGDGCIF